MASQVVQRANNARPVSKTTVASRVSLHVLRLHAWRTQQAKQSIAAQFIPSDSDQLRQTISIFLPRKPEGLSPTVCSMCSMCSSVS